MVDIRRLKVKDMTWNEMYTAQALLRQNNFATAEFKMCKSPGIYKIPAKKKKSVCKYELNMTL